MSLNLNLSFNESSGCPPQVPVQKFSYLLAFLFGIPACCIIVATIIGNFFVLCFKATVGKRQTSLLVWNLGLADFLVGIIVLPMAVAYTIGRKWPFGRLLCRLWTMADVVFCTASIVTLCVISVDRYIGVTRPLRYKVLVTKGRVVASIIGIWTFSIGILLSTLRYKSLSCIDPAQCSVNQEIQHVLISVVSAFFLPATVTLVLYWKIYVVAREREKCLKDGLLLTFGENFFTACVAHHEPVRVHCGRKQQMSSQQQLIRMHKLIAKTLGVVVTAFIICWLPYFACYIINNNCQCIPRIIPDILTWLGYCNSMINPIIYAFTIKDFKQAVRSSILLLQRKLTGQGAEVVKINNSVNQLLLEKPLLAVEDRNLNMAVSEKRRVSLPPETAHRLLKPTPADLRNLRRHSNDPRRFSHVATAMIETGLMASKIYEPTWSLKSYATLISPKVTPL